MKSKFKRITNESQLVGGQAYIRALINCHGKAWLEVFTINGGPYTKKGKYSNGRMIKTKGSYKNSRPREWFVSDMTLLYGKNRKPSNTGGLYRYSNVLYNLLNGMLNNRRQLMVFLGGESVTDKEFLDEIFSWEHLIWSDSVSDPSMAPIKTYESDSSVKDVIKKLYPEWIHGDDFEKATTASSC